MLEFNFENIKKIRYLINRVYVILIEKMVVCYVGRKKVNGFMVNVFLKKYVEKIIIVVCCLM